MIDYAMMLQISRQFGSFKDNLEKSNPDMARELEQLQRLVWMMEQHFYKLSIQKDETRANEASSRHVWLSNECFVRAQKTKNINVREELLELARYDSLEYQIREIVDRIIVWNAIDNEGKRQARELFKLLADYQEKFEKDEWEAFAKRFKEYLDLR